MTATFSQALQLLVSMNALPLGFKLGRVGLARSIGTGKHRVIQSCSKRRTFNPTAMDKSVIFKTASDRTCEEDARNPTFEALSLYSIRATSPPARVLSA
jgi:hypothetical protein